MSKRSWKEIEATLQADRPPAGMRPADAFWSDFKARARLCNQDSPAPARRSPSLMRWGLATACAAALAVLVVLQGLPGAPAGGSHIKSLEVVASHSAVLIMEDEPTESTILWIVDMSLENGDST